jgi:hypothetical protein
MFTGRKVLIALAGFFLFLLTVFAAWIWRGDNSLGEDILRRDRSRASAATSLTGAPLFEFGNLYLDGRSAWLRKRFQRDRKELISRAIPQAATVTSKVHREPFTEGPWLAALDGALARQRRETEEQAVESTATCFFPGVEPGRLLCLIATSNFQEAVEGNGECRREIFFPDTGTPPADLEELPALGGNRFLTRERYRRPLAMPTDLYFVNEIARDGEVHYLVYEAWRNMGDASHAAVRLASGQYALAARKGGALLHLHSFYSGQAIPPLMERVVESMAADFYRDLLKTLGRLTPSWEPPARAHAWMTGCRL